MNRSIIAGAALVLGMGIAAPMLAWSADAPQQQAQQSAPVPPPAGGPAAIGDMQGRPGMGPMGGQGRMADREGMGQMGQQGGWGGWHHRMMWGMKQMSPQQRCEERLARRAGVVAYTIAKLNLTDQQRPLWDKVRGALEAAGDKQRQICATLKPRDERANETVLDRMNRREQFLSAHLQAVQQIQPAMQQFYQALTPDQQAIINHPFHRG